MDYGAYRDQLMERLTAPDLPFTSEEFDTRLTRVRSAMAQRGLALLMVTEPSDICYLTGYATFEVSVQCILLVSEQATVLVVPAIEVGPAVYASRVDEVIGYPWESLAKAAQSLGSRIESLSGGRSVRVGISLWSNALRPGLLEAVRERLSFAHFVDMGDMLDRIRLVKSPAELAYLQQSAAITGAGLDEASKVVREGVVDHHIAQAGAAAMLGGGSEFMSMQPIVTTGFRSGIIHTNHAGYTVNRGDVAFLEFGSARRRYTAPMMRTAVIGEPSAEIQAFHSVCLAVLEAVMGAMRTGESFDQAAQAGVDALAPIADRAFFSGVYGYPVGIQFPPSWVAGSTFIARGSRAVFENDMVFHLPICLRKPAEFGIGFSETVRVTPTGAEAITRNDRTLHVYE